MDTVKVAINVCYGGFGLSPEAMKKLCQRRGKECYFFVRGYIDGKSFYIPTDNPVGSCFYTFSVKDPENHEYADIVIHEPKDRSDKDLIAVIEELGTKKASGRFAELRIVEIPADVKWAISEYDGMETVDEIHRSWNY
jgi:hypothetical protein